MIKEKIVSKLLWAAMDNGMHLNTDRCLINKSYGECDRCKKMCAMGAISEKNIIEMDRCNACNFCSTECPAQLIEPPDSLVAGIKRSLMKEGDVVTMACRNTEIISEDVRVHCMASIPWELLVILMCKGRLSIRTGKCSECELQDNKHNRLEQLKEHVSEEFFNEHIEFSDMERREYTRRDAAKDVHMRILSNITIKILPHNKSKGDGLYYRRLLIRELAVNEYLKDVLIWKQPVFGEKCWCCCLCAEVCPNGAILTKDDLLCFMPWRCTECGMCIDFCPDKAIQGFERCEYSSYEKGYISINCKQVKCEKCGHAMKKRNNKYRCLYCGETVNDRDRINRIIFDNTYSDDSHRSRKHKNDFEDLQKGVMEDKKTYTEI